MRILPAWVGRRVTAAPAAAGGVVPYAFAAGNGGPLVAINRYFEVSLFLLILTGVLTVVSTGKLDPVSSLLPIILLLVKAQRWKRGKGPELSHRAATWITAAYLVFFPVDLFFISRVLAEGAPNRELYAALLAAIHLMLFGMIVRLYSARTTRDHLFLTMLAFAMVLVAAIMTVDTAFVGFFFAFLVLSVSTFMGLEIRRSAEGAAAPPMATGTPAAKRLNRALGATSVIMAVGSLVLGTVIFFVIPRVTAGFLSGYNLQPSLVSGFSEDVELGQIGRIKKNPEVVMRVQIPGGAAQAANLRWRGDARTTFDGRRWFTEKHNEEVILPQGAEGWYYLLRWPLPQLRTNKQWLERERKLRALPQPVFTVVNYKVILEPMDTDTIFIATQGASVRGVFAPGVERVGQRGRRSYLQLDSTGALSNPFHNFTKIYYEARSAIMNFPPQLLREAGTDYPDEIRETYLQVPKLDPRVKPYAEQISIRATNPYNRAVAIEQFLKTRYGYTLDLELPPGANPLAYFLFTRKAGHCEYFATGMTIMLRTLGIPARYARGYQAGEYNDVGDDFIVRASDAHTWVEAYFPQYGWVTFDPTPASGERRRGWFGRLALYWDWLELMWIDWVVNYNFAQQVSLRQNVNRATTTWTEQLRRFWFQTKHESFRLLEGLETRFINVPAGVPAVLGALLLLIAATRSRAFREFVATQWFLRRGGAGVNPRMATLQYGQMLRLLARRGLHKAPGQTPHEFALSLTDAEFVGPVGELTELYQAARFGTAPGDAQRMVSLLETIKETLKISRR